MTTQETVVGLDVHADSITAAILPPTSDTPEVVKLSGDLDAQGTLDLSQARFVDGRRVQLVLDFLQLLSGGGALRPAHQRLDRLLFEVEDAGGPDMDVHFLGHRECFDHGPIGSQVAAQHRDAALRAEGIRARGRMISSLATLTFFK